jgi:hypothetical protein
MRRRIVIGLLALGTVAGFGSGFAQLRHARCAHGRCAGYRDAPAPVAAAAAAATPCIQPGSAPAAPAP